MAKRFTDTNKWKDSWYRNLKMKHKLAWSYLLDDCDQAGVWKADFDLLSFMVGEIIDEIEFGIVFSERLIRVSPDKYFIKKFIYFQYGELTSKNTMYSKVLRCLKDAGIDAPSMGYRWGIDGVKEEEEEEDKDKDKDKVKEEEKEKKKSFDFNALYDKFPLKVGKQLGIERLQTMIKTDDDYQLFSKAIDNYISYLKRTETFCKHFSSFVGTLKNQYWREWVSDETGSNANLKNDSVKINLGPIEKEYA